MAIARRGLRVLDILALGTGFPLATPLVPVMAAPFMGAR